MFYSFVSAKLLIKMSTDDGRFWHRSHSDRKLVVRTAAAATASSSPFSLLRLFELVRPFAKLLFAVFQSLMPVKFFQFVGWFLICLVQLPLIVAQTLTQRSLKKSFVGFSLGRCHRSECFSFYFVDANLFLQFLDCFSKRKQRFEWTWNWFLTFSLTWSANPRPSCYHCVNVDFPVLRHLNFLILS